MNALEAEIVEIIRADGPMPVSRYMGLCLGHPRHGYYTTRDPFGREGDFTTAPEISQMFGELIGLWAAHLWQAMGAPARFRLVELGPGRGTLMSDMLRATRILPGFREAASIHLVETSPALRARQAAALTGFDPVWHDGLASALEGPVILVANEFLDALPLDQFVMTQEGWRERLVGLDSEGKLAFGLAAQAEGALGVSAPAGSVFEQPSLALDIVGQVAGHVAAEGGAALFIDYGSVRSGYGDTLQAMRKHGFVDPLAQPGEADLTVHVDFERMGHAALKAGAALHGPASQRDFLLALGLAQRAQALSLKADADQRDAISAAFDRLIEPGETGMGELFKVLALSRPDLPLLPGFDLHRLPDQG
ncbi:class I SAM-dependent methyltransferase [Bosea sp. BH3]|uniref:class I SAM-dependent methyltransferase n=1 Tax=Bosea sp. BH3 TaxID=2871701 RepID=UPI0021CB2624|nr:SAM-dependent methyltransferase [Bosea sp. BH3]MCU4180968.1 SAM-dependent methyltransferase [Bosea sp. BH3]